VEVAWRSAGLRQQFIACLTACLTAWLTAWLFVWSVGGVCLYIMPEGQRVLSGFRFQVLSISVSSQQGFVVRLLPARMSEQPDDVSV
jgi:hypothetical protein